MTDNEYPDDQQPISWGEIANIQELMDHDCPIIGTLTLFDGVMNGELHTWMSATERSVALTYLESLLEEED